MQRGRCRWDIVLNYLDKFLVILDVLVDLPPDILCFTFSLKKIIKMVLQIRVILSIRVV